MTAAQQAALDAAKRESFEAMLSLQCGYGHEALVETVMSVLSGTTEEGVEEMLSAIKRHLWDIRKCRANG